MTKEPVKEQVVKTTKKHQQEKIKNAVNLLNEIVKVRIAPSKIHGVGLVAMRDIKEGERLYLDAVFQWLDVPYKYFKQDKRAPKHSRLRPEVAQLLLERWPLITKGSHFVYPDTRLQAYCNHSDYPNYDNKTDTAKRKIYEGEEITEDYRNVEGWEEVFLWIAPATQEKLKVNTKSAKKEGK